MALDDYIDVDGCYRTEELQHAEVFGYGVWLRGIDTDIGTIYAVQYEGKGQELFTDLIYSNAYKADKLFKRRVTELVKGKHL